jgi:hypothetical protein
MRGKVFWLGSIGLLIIAILLLRMQTPQPLPSARADRVVTNAAATESLAGEAPPSSTNAVSPGRETEADRRERLISNEKDRSDFKLSEADVYLYLQANKSNAMSLVTAFEISRDKDYLKTALEKFPKDPFVLAKALLFDAVPEDRAKLIEQLKESSPDNALPHMFAARDAMSSGDVARALAEVKASEGKSFNDFTRESAQGLEEAYLLAGRSIAEAKALGSAEITLPHLAQIKAAGRQMLELAEQRAAAGDTAGQLELLKANWQLGASFRNSGNQGILITDYVGLSMQNPTLSKWPAGTPAPFLARTPEEELAANKNYRQEMREITPMFEKWFPHAPEHEIITYMDRVKTFGEQNAMLWLKERHPELLEAVDAR